MIENSWDNVLNEEYKKPYFTKLVKYINNIYSKETIFPPKTKILRSLNMTDYNDVKVVILGQDPYHGVGEANGLSFSVEKGVRIPPSLKNIYKELNSDLNIPIPTHGDLTCWAKEGVLLLNSVLTVIKDSPASHKNIGWEEFTDTIIKKLNERQKPVVFILWGAFARSKKVYITNQNHCIIESAHPSPFSAYYGFLGSKPFSKANAFLKENNLKEVNWEVE